MGMRNAAVFPEPVGAQQSSSLKHRRDCLLLHCCGFFVAKGSHVPQESSRQLVTLTEFVKGSQ